MKYTFFLFLALLSWVYSIAQLPAHATWKLVWSDEFNGANADLDTGWNSSNGGYLSSTINCSRWRNNAIESDSTLKLTYRKEKTSGGSGTSAWNYDWTAGSISTKRKFKFGYFECRYKIATSKGTNNSFWLISSKNKDTSIKTFEIDINEGQFANSSTDTWNQVRTNVHNWSDTFRNSSGTLTHPSSSLSTNPNPWYNVGYEYHIMGLEWNENELIWYLDGKIIRISPNVNAYKAPVNCYDFAPIYLSAATIPWMNGINGVIPDSVNGKNMEVDYVRVYENVTQPQPKIICRGDKFFLVANPTLQDSTTYKWQVSIFNNGIYLNWRDLVSGSIATTTALGIGANYSGVASDTLVVKNGPISLQNARFRCKVNNNILIPATTIVINEPIVASIKTVNAPNYWGSTVRLLASASGGSGNYVNHVWAGPNNFAKSGNLVFINNFSAKDTGIYTVHVYDSFGCVNKANIFLSAINSTNPPLLVTSTTPNSITSFSNLNLNANPVGGSGVYQSFNWVGPNGFSSNLQSPSIIPATIANAGSYTVFVTDDAGFTGSKTLFIDVNKRSQTINFTQIPNATYMGSESNAIELMASASSNLPVNFKSSNTALLSIVGNTFVVNRKRPDYNIELASPIITNKVRIYSSQAANFQIGEFRVFAPNANGYPQNVFDDIADYHAIGLINFANLSTTSVSVSGTYDSASLSNKASNAVDGLISTNWMCQTGNTDKFIELKFDSAVQVGCVQFINGFFSAGAWQGLMTSFSVQYWNGNTWVDLYDCNMSIAAIQNGDSNNLAQIASQSLCVNIVKQTITNNSPLPLTFISFNADAIDRHKASLNWQIAYPNNLLYVDIEVSNDSKSFTLLKTLSKSEVNNHYVDDLEQYNAVKSIWYRLKMVGDDGSYIYSTVRQIQLQKDANLLLYPSPSSNILEVRFMDNSSTKGGTVQVFDCLGQKMLQYPFLNHQLSIDVSRFPVGKYLVLLMIDGKTLTQRFIKN